MAFSDPSLRPAQESRDTVIVYVEIPTGSRNRYEFSEELGGGHRRSTSGGPLTHADARNNRAPRGAGPFLPAPR
jgi:hypothetical protein